ncbi:MAG TPA: 2Fe-2S iron-sulfur cluster-binding protein [Aggregatilineales bacterium]|jgi:ferredoxin|nr:2Fe-2S iron-sulfur cluster-binding protein [Aggregatilineales bacterium]
MPKITVHNGESFDVDATKRLVLALEDNGVDILHRCGGNARCTTCRVVFHAGEPQTMTVAERDKLQERDLIGQFRLSCQILCDHDMTVEPVNLLSTSGLDDPGSRPADHITPDPEWVERP